MKSVTNVTTSGRHWVGTGSPSLALSTRPTPAMSPFCCSTMRGRIFRASRRAAGVGAPCRVQTVTIVYDGEVARGGRRRHGPGDVSG